MNNTSADKALPRAATTTSVNSASFYPSKVGPTEAASSLDVAKRGGNAVNLWMKENIRRVVLEDRLERVNEELENAKAEEEEQKLKFPNHRAMHEQIGSVYKRFQLKADKLSARLQESAAKESELIASMNDQQRTFMAGALPVAEAEAEAYSQTSNIVPQMQEIENKLRQQELELRDLKTFANSHNTEEQHAIQKKLMEQDHRLIACENQITGHSSKLEENRQSLQSYGEPLNAHKQSISDLDHRLTSSEALQREQVNGIAEVKARLKSHDFQFANLSSVFTPQKDYKDLLGANAELKNQVKNQVKQLQTSMHEVKDDLLQTIKLSAQTHGHVEPNQALPLQDIHHAKEDIQRMQEEVVRLDTIVAELKTKSSSSPTHTDVTTLQNKVEKLSSFQGHYEKFYKDTEASLIAKDNSLQKLRERQSTLEGRQNEAQKATSAKLTDHDRAIANLRGQVQTLQPSAISSASLSEEVTTKLSNVEKQYNGFTQSVEATTKQNMAVASAAAKAQFDALKHELDSVKPLIYRNDSSIKALDTRWNAISTAHLHKNIMNSLIPLGPLCEQLKEDHAKLSARVNEIQHGNARVQQQIDVLRSKTDQISALSQGGDALSELADKVKQLQEQLILLQSKAESAPDGTHQLLEATQTLRGRIIECETKADRQQESLTAFEQHIATSTQRTIGISKDIQHIRTLTDQIPSFQSAIATMRNQVEELESHTVTDVIQRVEELQKAIDGLRNTMKEFDNEVVPTNTTINGDAQLTDIRAVVHDHEKSIAALVYREDSFVKIANLASTVSEGFLKHFIEKEPDATQVRNIWIRGNKDINKKTTNRHALVQIQTPDPYQVVRKVNGVGPTRQRWKGREPSAVVADAQAIEAALLNKPIAEQEPSSSATSLPLPTIPGTESAAATIDDQDDTITVDDTANPASSQVSPPLNSDYLDMWTRPGPSNTRTTPAGPSRTSTPGTSATISARGSKRKAEEPGRSNSTSRLGSKRGRYNS